MFRKGSTAAARKRLNPIARWARYLLAGGLLLLAVLGAADWMQATPAAPEPFAAAGATSSAGGGSGSAPTLYAHGAQLRPLVEETNGVQTLNICGPGGQIIAQATRDDQGNEGVRYLLTDHLGSTRVALDADGNVVARFESGPYGETTASGTAAAGVRYRYTGHPYDKPQGLYETPARQYDPTLGRFLSVDPQRQDASLYAYAGNNPINKVDPDGQGEIYFYLYSGAASPTAGPYGQQTRRREMRDLKLATYASSPHDIVVQELESTHPLSLPRSLNIKHLAIDFHGDPTLVDVLDTET